MNKKISKNDLHDKWKELENLVVREKREIEISNENQDPSLKKINRLRDRTISKKSSK